MNAVLALDAGTTGVTALVIAEDGRVTGRGYREITQHYPRPGWVEHDAEEIFTRAVDAARDALAVSKVAPTAIGITNQRETIVMWERATGRPIHRAIVWQDRRTAVRCTAMEHEGPRIAQRTGLVLDPYFSATKLQWLLEAERPLERWRPEELAVGTIDSWLIWCLTGGAVHATDPTNASRTMLYDIDARRWSAELCALFGVPAALLPEVRPSSGSFGTALAGHLGAALPIAGVAGDQQAALFGQGCWRAGEGKNTYGTGAFVLMNTGAERPGSAPGVLTTLACDARGEVAYALEGAIFIAGAAVQWLRDELGIVASATETEFMARGLPSNDGVYFVPALTGLGTPNWEPRARGMLTGLTRGTSRAHLARAAREAIAYATRDVLALMAERAGARFERLRVDGGAAQNDWLMQFQADVLGVPVERPALVETTALGAAGLAGLATGVWRDAGEFLQARAVRLFEPGPGVATAREAVRGWERAVRAALAWAADDAGAR
ncbi:MAG: glycerol kinase GlpK [Gemmatimonadaceae bacterium]